MIAWFVTTSVLGVAGITGHPAVLKARSPTYAASFLVHHISGQSPGRRPEPFVDHGEVEGGLVPDGGFVEPGAGWPRPGGVWAG
ncbi:K+ potassium transporter [Parafrankia irregularis]|uniref:K+ potassium transporter n=1 Tax=Parafrankia irregularis TaxID=795642 RepID=A0A0S4QXV6_9ACTN|nr:MULTISPECIES: KUP/HAK/KT family potassium transporter [Parafrankia]MBE3201491.1 KUP/HAK/KT family potassium transporter [Parafrankia sp. CH37]CUU60365.1 K+ potassium transporter [Parafrankia irregularis]